MNHIWTAPPPGIHYELFFDLGDGFWAFMGWVEPCYEPTNGKWRVLCCWMAPPHIDYPEGREFDTVKQARRALKSHALVAFIGGFRGHTTLARKDIKGKTQA